MAWLPIVQTGANERQRTICIENLLPDVGFPSVSHIMPYPVFAYLTVLAIDLWLITSVSTDCPTDFQLN